MKQLLSLFLFLLPCLAWAQYPSNGNQKITLGEQTTADGLIYRGVAADTTLTAKSDTAAYFVLDTANLNLYTYKASATGKKWRQLGADTAAIAYVNTYGTQTVNGAKTFSSTVTGARFNPTANTVTGTGMYLPSANALGLSTNNLQRLHITSSGDIGINTASPLDVFTSRKILTINSTGTPNYGAFINFGINGTLYAYVGPTTDFFYMGSQASIPFIMVTSGGEKMRLNTNGEVWMGYTTDQGAYRLQVKDSVYVGGNVSAAAYTTRSDYNLKDDIFDIKYGLNDILQLQPVEYTYKSNGSKQLGFIAQDIGTILPEVVSFEDSMSVNYQAIIPILTKAIQEQNLLIKALEQRIINLENK
jgi:hypothetical protein